MTIDHTVIYLTSVFTAYVAVVAILGIIGVVALVTVAWKVVQAVEWLVERRERQQVTNEYGGGEYGKV